MKPYMTGGSLFTAGVSSFRVAEHVTLTQLCCVVGPDLLQNRAGLAELGKQHNNNIFLRLCDSYCCKPFHLSLGSIVLLRNLCLI